MPNKDFDRVRSILKEKGTMPIGEVSKRLNCSDLKSRQLLLQYFSDEVGHLPADADFDRYKYLFKVFKFFDDIADENEKRHTIQNLETAADLCTRRIKKINKDKKKCVEEPIILQKFLDSIKVALINLKYKEIVKTTALSANEVSYNLLNYLIYDVRNYNYLFELLKMFPKNLALKNKQGVYLIDELIMKYIESVQNNNSNSEIIYYEKVINLFITDPKFNIEPELKSKLVCRLEGVLDEIGTGQSEHKDKDKSSFFIKEVISDIKINEDEERNIAQINYKYDVNPRFSEDVLNESKRMITLDNKEQVLDCRDKYTVTVDGEYTWTYDDACSLEKLDNGHYLLGIYVTDATIAVPRNSLIDLEARKRAESIYLGGSVITMLPVDLTQRLTLKQNEDRNAIGYFFELDENVNCLNFTVRRCLINVNNNYSYDKVNTMLTDSKNIEEIKNMKNMYYISSKFHENSNLRMQYRTLKSMKKAIKANTPSTDVTTNIAAAMIADFMTQTNAYVADYFNKHPEIPFIYRINLSSYGSDTIKKIKDISGKEISFEDMLNYLNYICPPSIYSTVNLGHNGLVLPAYCHSTNPLRNYSSLEIERIIVDHMINDGRHVDLQKSREYLDGMCEYMNSRINLNMDYVEEVKQLYKKQ
jgi:hypothetical protein